MKTFHSIDPFDQSLIAEYELFDSKQLDAVLENSGNAFQSWSKTDIDHRSELMIKAAKVLRDNKEKYAMLMSKEMGKVISESRGEVEKCAWNCEYFAEQSPHMLEAEIMKSDAFKSYVVFEPLGCVFAIMPWNFPFWQVFRFAAPVLMAGNTIILKHAPNVCGCSLAIEDIFREAGFPEHVFQSIIVDTDVTEKIIAHSSIQGITLTGSEIAGSIVASLAGKYTKKSVMELGGSDALIVLDDANLHTAARIALQSRYQNAGQSCIAAKRFIITPGIKDDFIQALINGVQTLKQGFQLAEGITTGPMARIDLAEKLEQQVEQSIKKGGDIIIGGKRNGANYIPGIIKNVSAGMPAFDEELFGPMAAIIEAKDDNDAVEIANMSRYGLGASIFTEDFERAELLARKINAGSVFINSMVKSDPRLPFGGIKNSGYGRELSHYGIKEFTNIKTISVEE